jgi:hypothetical protein
MFDELDGPDHSDDADPPDKHWKIVEQALVAIGLLIITYILLRPFGWFTGLIASVVVTLAAFAIYQWVRVWRNARRQERGPEDDGAPVTLNLSSSGSRPADADDERA